MRMAKINWDDVEARLGSGEKPASIAKRYGITRQALVARRRAHLGLNSARAEAAVGNTFIDQWGYVMVRTGDKNRINPYVPQHILAAEKAIDRRLERGEVVHHINGIKSDNRPENLLVLTRKEHRKLHAQLEALAMEMVRTGKIVFIDGVYQWDHDNSQ